MGSGVGFSLLKLCLEGVGVRLQVRAVLEPSVPFPYGNKARRAELSVPNSSRRGLMKVSDAR